MMQYFTYNEFDQKDLEGSGEEYMDRPFLDKLDRLRDKCGFPFIITSGYRTPIYNNDVSTTGFDGPHTTGKAADISVDTKQAYILMENALKMDCFYGIGVGRGFMHLDTLLPIEKPRPRLWPY